MIARMKVTQGRLQVVSSESAFAPVALLMLEKSVILLPA
jgi:hypothetical protein